MKSIAGTFVVICALAAMTGAAQAKPVEQRVEADTRGSVQVTLTAGRVNCVGWDKPQVEVSGDLADDEERLDVQREGNIVTIRVLKATPSVHWLNETHLTIKMPVASGVRVTAVNAKVAVSGVTGEQRLQTVSGDIDAEVAAADVDVKSLSGNVKVRGRNAADAHLTLSTVSGKVDARQVSGDLDLDTVSGDVALDMAMANRVKLKSISSDIAVVGRLDRNAHVEASSVSGHLTLRWRGSDAARINADSFSGDISTCLAGVSVSRSAHGPGHSLQYNPANASAELRAKSLSGDIEICDK